MSAQSVRLNTVASNLANADSVSGDPNSVYQAKHPVFQAVMGSAPENAAEAPASRSPASPRVRRRPSRVTTPVTRSPMRKAMSMRPKSTWSRR